MKFEEHGDDDEKGELHESSEASDDQADANGFVAFG